MTTTTTAETLTLIPAVDIRGGTPGRAIRRTDDARYFPRDRFAKTTWEIRTTTSIENITHIGRQLSPLADRSFDTLVRVDGNDCVYIIREDENPDSVIWSRRFSCDNYVRFVGCVEAGSDHPVGAGLGAIWTVCSPRSCPSFSYSKTLEYFVAKCDGPFSTCGLLVTSTPTLYGSPLETIDLSKTGRVFRLPRQR